MKFWGMLWLLPGLSLAQSTQGLIQGQVRGRDTNSAGAFWIEYCKVDPSGTVERAASTKTDDDGYYFLPQLTPGEYRLRAQSSQPPQTPPSECFSPPGDTERYQAQEKHDLHLPVAGRLVVDFDLRPTRDVWDGKYAVRTRDSMLLRYFGADARQMKILRVDTGPAADVSSAATLSYVLDAEAIGNLPLNGRDLFSALVVLPGVTSESGTGRGLGLAVNGLRSTSSNYLQDGVENNNYLTSGPMTILAPEAAEEYRISVNNFSAEYGRAAGFIANAISRRGSNNWHGLVYGEGLNEALMANSRYVPRTPLHQTQLGTNVGGALIPDRLFVALSLDAFRSRDRLTPTLVNVPGSDWATRSRSSPPLNQLLSVSPPPPTTGPTRLGDYTANVIVAQPVSQDRILGQARLDSSSASGKTRLTGRVTVVRAEQPDFIWSPYAGYSSTFSTPTEAVSVTVTRLFSRARANEVRLGLSRERIGWDRPHPEVPTLTVSGPLRTLLPGSPAAYGYLNRSGNLELSDTYQDAAGRHSWKAGGGLLIRRLNARLDYGSSGHVDYFSLSDIYFQEYPSQIQFAIDRLTKARPQYDREYSQWQMNLFAEDTIRFRRFTLNLGIRFENFESPQATGPLKNYSFEPGTNPIKFSAPSGTQTQDQLPSTRGNFGGRFGFSYAPDSTGATVIRGAYGMFFDRPYDNLWLNLANNNIALVSVQNVPDLPNYFTPPNPASFNLTRTVLDFPQPLRIDPAWKTGLVQSYFAGLERRMSPAWSLALNAAGSLGRHLMTTDVLGRDSVASTYALRGSQGSSAYHSLSAMVRRKARSGSLQVAYTLSHSIDNQSDALAGDFFDLAFKGSPARSAFSLPGQWWVDRGNSNFDQRHNLVFYAYQQIPAFGRRPFWRGWSISGLGAVRSGFPYTATATALGPIYNQRPNLVLPDAVYLPDGGTPAPNGRRLLNSAAFGKPKDGVLGSLGRNSLAGPGLASFDLSLARTFGLKILGDAGRLTVRADAYNFLSRLNLGRPQANYADLTTFGVATYGIRGAPSPFPGVKPFAETPARVQVIVRLMF